MIIVILGAQGSGKGTVGKKLAEQLKLAYISTGEIFREHIKNNTELGMAANKYILEGNLVPDKITSQILSERLSMPDVLNSGAIIDGYPRSVEQCKKLDEILNLLNMQVDYAINLDVPYDELIHRITTRRICKNCRAGYNTEYNPTKKDGVCDICGGEVVQRADDIEGAVKQRLNIYYTNEKEILDYYMEKGKLRVEKAGDKIGRTSEQVVADLVIDLSRR